jgi:hypothetical protein
MKCTVVGEGYTCTHIVLRVSYMYVHIFVLEGTEHSAFCSHVQVLLPPYVDVIVWPCAVVSILMFRFAMWITLQQAISAATTQKECDPQQEQHGFLCMNGAALYEQHDEPPISYMTEPRHRAFVNGMTTKWHEIGGYRFATTKCCHCVLLTCSDSDNICWWLTELWPGLSVPRVLSSWHVVGSLYFLNNAPLNSHCHTIVVSCYLIKLHGCFI